MRRLLLGVLTIALLLPLAACGASGDAEEEALALRDRYIDMDACTLTADIRADYGERVYDFTVDAVYQKDGESRLTVTAPALLAGLTVCWKENTASLCYEDITVETGYLTEDGLSPMTALPALLDALRTGGLTACSRETGADGTETLRVTMEDEAVSYTFWFDPDTGAPRRAEIAADGYTVITCRVTAFQFG